MTGFGRGNAGRDNISIDVYFRAFYSFYFYTNFIGVKIYFQL